MLLCRGRRKGRTGRRSPGPQPARWTIGPAITGSMDHRAGRTGATTGQVRLAGVGGEGRGDDRTLVAVRAPLPGTFYRAPRPGAEPFVEVGSRVTAETVVCIVET